MMNLYIGIEIERVSTQIRYYVRLSIKLGLRIIIHGRTFMKTRLQKCMFDEATVVNNIELLYTVVFLLK